MVIGNHSGLRGWRYALLLGIWAGVALLCLTPFVVTQSTGFPFVVGKALYSRALIEIICALWAVLALYAPGYRPRWSWVLALLGAGLAASLLSAAFGVSFGRSIWSTYERMQGVLDQAHWVALAVVLVSVLRTPESWRALFTVHLAASVGIAALATLRYFELDAFSHISNVPERSWRMEASFGNSAFLGAYALVSSILALGLASWSFATCWGASAGRRWAGRTFWVFAAMANLWTLTLSGALASFLGLLAGVGFVALLYLLFGRARRGRYAAGGVVGLLAVAGIGLGWLFFFGSASLPDSSPLLTRLNAASVSGFTTRSRLAAWETGYQGFLDRPLLGWGPENFIVPFGRYGTGLGATMVIHDNAHNDLIEQAATKGIVGLAVYVVFWLVAFLMVIRAARAAEADEQLLVLFLAAALMAELVLRQALFSTTVGWLLHVMVIGCIAHLEASANARRPAIARRLAAAAAAAVGRAGVRPVLAGIALALGAGGIWMNHAVYSGAQAFFRVAVYGSAQAVVESVNVFAPLANYPRRVFFFNLEGRWEEGRRRDPRGARNVLAYVDRQAALAMAWEPENWYLVVALARMYAVIAATEPNYAAAAAHYRARALELAPERAAYELTAE